MRVCESSNQVLWEAVAWALRSTARRAPSASPFIGVRGLQPLSTMHESQMAVQPITTPAFCSHPNVYSSAADSASGEHGDQDEKKADWA